MVRADQQHQRQRAGKQQEIELVDGAVPSISVMSPHMQIIRKSPSAISILKTCEKMSTLNALMKRGPVSRDATEANQYPHRSEEKGREVLAAPCGSARLGRLAGLEVSRLQ